MRAPVFVLALVAALHCAAAARVAARVEQEPKVEERVAMPMKDVTPQQPPSSAPSSQPCTHPCSADSGSGMPDPAATVKPVEDWLRDFKHRTQADVPEDAADAVVKPMVSRLERRQREAIRKLEHSYQDFNQHVARAASSHINHLLRSSNKSK